MSWREHHKQSEFLASQAQSLLRLGRHHEAYDLYSRAAKAEAQALNALDVSKTRTLGISAVSAVSLFYKATDFASAEKTAIQWLACESLPSFAADQLRILLQTVWSERVREQSETQFAPGEVVISVKGGEVVEGGAPLNLIVDKVQIVQTLFYRTAEFLSKLPHRTRGLPDKEIQDYCRPWLFQRAPGSYQFAVAVQESPFQKDWLKEDLPVARDVADCFLSILHNGIEDPVEGLSDLVPQPEYRSTFLKLTRNLAPNGKICGELEVQSADGSRVVKLDPEVRKNISEAVRTIASPDESPPTLQSLKGILRAVDLDRDWLEVVSEDDKPHRVRSVGEQVDDVIGPLVNKPVIVHVQMENGVAKFKDIEPDD